ncbi:glutamine-hydrolyzing carbamoyl-phosphate synthase small subunit [Pseudoglutamicibacter cumminsii]|uniref:glutamine-hydrolyzing carbamoyl-phosphate synthase small subunit n=1 Tax=Pseudoglutamicibacter cumminsii TaxID=156979 RepID=UPI0021A567E8|nr:glutamine-hydrolyzing carbamoyl-phosphate synthase small subunit [Pseudoglutamicibacter cumminsii]MCT1685537.1 glutamine-hydrolyzing carbamoyl-phosphate synthase small subunit [Pseudoglutamicibacter cumminsii]MDK7082631.1 glutamine-hydrolyzing carbamoyl-phosphate synthase small subunit [Pseudoglutamicibacter cumminsii]
MAHTDHDKALLVTEDGRVFRGTAYGKRGQTLGELVFTTGMTGYQETLTDPSYAGQIVVQTFPHIGNTGANPTDNESAQIWVAGYAVREPSRIASNWRSETTLDDELERDGIVGIAGIDTRAVTRHIRTAGAMKAGIFSGEAADKPVEELVETVKGQPSMQGQRLSDVVTTKESYWVDPADHGWEGEPVATVAALDLGIKGMTPRRLAERGVRVRVLPAASTIDDIKGESFDGVFISNGPGDPAQADPEVQFVRDVLDANIPLFGICFGNQILGRALGFSTYKLPFGHRGMNQPVLDKATGRVEITSQNHGFAIDIPVEGTVEAPESRFGRVEVSHIGLNDQVVEGIRCLDIPAFSVQYHPESGAGPHDSSYLFDRFIELMQAHTAQKEG